MNIRLNLFECFCIANVCDGGICSNLIKLFLACCVVIGLYVENLSWTGMARIFYQHCNCDTRHDGENVPSFTLCGVSYFSADAPAQIINKNVGKFVL